jgi:hypothetical protein
MTLAIDLTLALISRRSLRPDRVGHQPNHPPHGRKHPVPGTRYKHANRTRRKPSIWKRTGWRCC